LRALLHTHTYTHMHQLLMAHGDGQERAKSEETRIEVDFAVFSEKIFPNISTKFCKDDLKGVSAASLWTGLSLPFVRSFSLAFSPSLAFSLFVSHSLSLSFSLSLAFSRPLSRSFARALSLSPFFCIVIYICTALFSCEEGTLLRPPKFLGLFYKKSVPKYGSLAEET